MTCEHNVCDGSGVVGAGEGERCCTCPAGVDLLADVLINGKPAGLAIEDVEEDVRSRGDKLAALGAPAWVSHDLSDAEEGPFVRVDLDEIPPFDPPAERVQALREARLAAEESEAA